MQKKVDGLQGEYWAFTTAEATWPRRRLLPRKPDFWFRGGCTLIIDPETGQIRYSVSKSVKSEGDARLGRQREFERTGALPTAADTYFGSDGRNPFALLHSDE